MEPARARSRYLDTLSWRDETLSSGNPDTVTLIGLIELLRCYWSF